MKKIRLFLLCTTVIISFSCQEESGQINSLPVPVDKEKLNTLASHFNSTLSKSAALDFHKLLVKEIPNSIVLKDFLSILSENDLKIANAVLNHQFFKSVFYESSPSALRTKEEQILSVRVNQLTEELISNIETSISNFIPVNDLEVDKLTLSNNLFNVVNAFEVKVTSDATLDVIDRSGLLQNVEFQRQTIPTLIDLALSIGTESQGGRVKRWSKFWKIVAVVVVTVAAAAIIGAAAGAAYAYVQGAILGSSAAAIGTAAAAASVTGLYIGAGVGAVVGSIAGSNGNCPANGWFSSSIPLVDWQKNCI